MQAHKNFDLVYYCVRTFILFIKSNSMFKSKNCIIILIVNKTTQKKIKWGDFQLLFLYSILFIFCSCCIKFVFFYVIENQLLFCKRKFT